MSVGIGLMVTGALTADPTHAYATASVVGICGFFLTLCAGLIAGL